MPEIITHVDQMLYDSRQAGRREVLGHLAAKQFNGRTAKRLEALLKDIDDPNVLDRIAEAVIDCKTGKEFLDVVRGAFSSHADAGKGLSDPH